MNDIHETIEGFTVEVVPDEDPPNPREYDNLGLMLCNHPRYNLGDESLEPGSHESLEALLEWLQETYDPTVIMPLYLLDHSGLSIRAGSPATQANANDVMDRTRRFIGDEQGWDTSLIGFILDTAESRKNIGVKDDNIRECLEGEVETYDQYLTGEVYGYVISAPDGREIDACFGFYGDPDTVLQEGVNALKYHAECPDCDGSGHALGIEANIIVQVTRCPRCERFPNDEAAARDVLAKLGGGVLELTVDDKGATQVARISKRAR